MNADLLGGRLMRVILLVAVLSATSYLTGCAVLSGPRMAVTSGGPVITDGQLTGIQQTFFKAEANARNAALGLMPAVMQSGSGSPLIYTVTPSTPDTTTTTIITSTTTTTSVAGRPAGSNAAPPVTTTTVTTMVTTYPSALLTPNVAQEAARVMLDSGFALVYANCSEFFNSAGESQKWIGVSRDAVALIGSLGASVLALHTSHANAAANLALGTGASFAVLDAYTKNFLFGAENIDAVRNLVSNALNTHQQAVLALGPFTYASALTQILDDQDICTPASITALAREAIKKGKVEPSVSGGQEDKAVLDVLGTQLGLPSAATKDEALAMWWLLKEGDLQQYEVQYGIAPMLTAVPTDKFPIEKKNWTRKPGWAPQASVNAALDSLSSSTKVAMRAAIPDLRAQAKAAVDAVAHRPLAAPPPIVSTFTWPASRSSSARVMIQVK